MKENEIKKQINSRLSIGDSREQVEDALKNINIAFSYHEYSDYGGSNRYEATIRDEQCGPYLSLGVYIVLGKSEKVSEIKVFKSYTVP